MDTIPTEAHPPPQLSPALLPRADALPITEGDAGGVREERAPEHDWPATLFILLANVTALGMVVGAVAIVGIGVWKPDFMTPKWIGIAALLLAGSVLQRRLATNVQHFARWGWYGAMAELAFVTLAKVNVLLTDADGGTALVGIVIDLLWMRYFWRHRADFDVELGL
jgi:hypothetical protein